MEDAQGQISSWHIQAMPTFVWLGLLMNWIVVTQTIFIVKNWAKPSSVLSRLIPILNWAIVALQALFALDLAYDIFLSWYSGVEYHTYAFLPYNLSYQQLWLLTAFQYSVPFLLILKRIRSSYLNTFFVILYLDFYILAPLFFYRNVMGTIISVLT